MRYPEELIEEIRQANDIVDVVGSYVKLKRSGSNYTGLCPFHSEKSPSFSVSSNKQIYKCFGCGEGGNVYGFLMKYENFTFLEAVQSLAERAHISLPEMEFSEQDKKRAQKREKLLDINKEAAKYFYFQLRAKQGEKGLAYFRQRQLSDETMKKFGLGYANVTSDDLTQYLKSKGYSEDIILESALAGFDEKYGFHDKFWNRVMFPIFDAQSHVIGFGGRVLGDGKPKYLNSQETMIFDKGRNLYGLNIARSTRRDYMILCEGYMDVIAMHQAGFDCAVASLGTAFTEGQAKILKNLKKSRIILAYDSDGAGVNAAMRAIGILKGQDIPARVLDLKPYKDPDEFIKNMGVEAFEERIEKAENSFFFELRIMARDFDLNDPGGKTRYEKAIAEKLCEFSEALERDNYIKAVSDRLSIPFDSLNEAVKKYAARAGNVELAPKPRSSPDRKNKDPLEGSKKPQRVFVTTLVDNPGLYGKIKKYISLEDFTFDIYKRAAKKLFEDLENGVVNPAAIISTFEDEEEQKEVTSLFYTEIGEISDPKEKEKAFKDVLYAFKENSYQYFVANAGSELSAITKVAQAKKDLEEIKRIKIDVEE